jgi:hypothetical protein
VTHETLECREPVVKANATKRGPTERVSEEAISAAKSDLGAPAFLFRWMTILLPGGQTKLAMVQFTLRC